MLDKTIEFLRGIGLTVTVVPQATGFFEKVHIINGTLEIEPDCPPTDLLHEAGHLAVVPERFRSKMHVDIDFGVQEMLALLDAEGPHPDSEQWRTAIQAGEAEATAWQWAAGKAIGLPDEMIIVDADYEGTGDEVRAELQSLYHVGIKGLSHAGFCKTRADYPWPGEVYPKLNYWLQR